MHSVRVAISLCLFVVFIGICPFLYAESRLDGDPVLGEEILPEEEAILSEETAPEAEARLSAETAPEAETRPSAETAPKKDNLLSTKTAPDDDDFFDEDAYYALLFEAQPFVFQAPPVYKPRPFDEVFPGLSPARKYEIMNDYGLRYAFTKDESPNLIPAADSGINLLDQVMQRKPSHIIEALIVVPYQKRELDMLDIYNALGRIRNIKDQTLPTRGGGRASIFLDTTRIESARNRNPVPDPAQAHILPYSETMYLCLTEAFMGDLYVRGDITIGQRGITYSITNFSDIRFSLFRIMKAERFLSVIYLEPIKEGVLVYSLSGIYLPGFIADKLNLTYSMNIRISALINWIADGLREQDNIVAIPRK